MAERVDTMRAAVTLDPTRTVELLALLSELELAVVEVNGFTATLEPNQCQRISNSGTRVGPLFSSAHHSGNEPARSDPLNMFCWRDSPGVISSGKMSQASEPTRRICARSKPRRAGPARISPISSNREPQSKHMVHPEASHQPSRFPSRGHRITNASAPSSIPARIESGKRDAASFLSALGNATTRNRRKPRSVANSKRNGNSVAVTRTRVLPVPVRKNPEAALAARPVPASAPTARIPLVRNFRPLRTNCYLCRRCTTWPMPLNRLVKFRQPKL